MKFLLSWVSAAAFAFAVTAGAFLLLANLGTGPSETDLPSRPEEGQSGPALSLTIRKDGLAALSSQPDQELSFDLKNESERELRDVSIFVTVFPEDTSVTSDRGYEATVERLAPDETATAKFSVDLSPPPDLETRVAAEPPRWIIEARATTPDGVSAGRTVILPRQTS
jgi:hypothetical protein